MYSASLIILATYVLAPPPDLYLSVAVARLEIVLVHACKPSAG